MKRRLALTVALFSLACDASSPPDDGSLRLERLTVADTTMVRNMAGSVWGDSLRLDEELRIGVPDGDAEYAFGNVQALAVGNDGTIYVYDDATPALRSYSTEGRHLRLIGGVGAGPGEYRQVIGLALTHSGELLLRDPMLGRITRFSATGEALSPWTLASRLYTDDALVTDTLGFTYARVLTGRIEPDKAWPVGFVRLDPNGSLVDTIPAPVFPEVPEAYVPYHAQALWTRHLSGAALSASGAYYRVYITHSDGSVLTIERPTVPAVSIDAAERAELDDILDVESRDPDEQGQRPPSKIAPQKPMLQALRAAGDGRIWVRPSVPSKPVALDTSGSATRTRRNRSWYEPTAWDIFEEDGRFLGRLPIPDKATVHVMRGDLLWGVQRDSDDIPYVVRWRIAGKRSEQ